MKRTDYKIILASASPRRAELLSQIGLDFEVIPSGLKENTSYIHPGEYAAALANEKARDIALRLQEEKYPEQKRCIIIGADTVVFADGKILGKPKNEEDALQMLMLLSGEKHIVYTGLSLVYPGMPERNENWYEQCIVHMEKMDEGEIRDYIKSGEPMDKAGAYGIQGGAARFISALEGDYYTVMGLPLSALWKRIKDLFI